MGFEIDIIGGLLVRRMSVAHAVANVFNKGVYVNDVANRKAGIAGQTYGGAKKPSINATKSSAWAEVTPAERSKLIYRTSIKKHFNAETGTYTALRQKKHGEIINKVTNVPEQEKPHAILLLGGGASGKSHVYQTMVKPNMPDAGKQYAYLNNDDIKEELPEYEEYKKVDAPSAAARVHDESRDITKMCLRSLKNSKKNFVYDATLMDYDKALNLVGDLKKAGYTLDLVGVIVDTKTAEINAKKRYQSSGRSVPDYILRSAQLGSRRTFYKMEKHSRELFANMSLYNNDGSVDKKPPVKIYENGKQLDEEKYNMVRKYRSVN